jgi:hypothetical protein
MTPDISFPGGSHEIWMSGKLDSATLSMKVHSGANETKIEKPKDH